MINAQKEIRTNNPKEIPAATYKAIFFGTQIFYKGNPLRVTHTSKQHLKQLIFGVFVFIEQNPNSGSKYALMAKEGHKIVWCIERGTGRYVGRILDGKVEKF